MLQNLQNFKMKIHTYKSRKYSIDNCTRNLRFHFIIKFKEIVLQYNPVNINNSSVGTDFFRLSRVSLKAQAYSWIMLSFTPHCVSFH